MWELVARHHEEQKLIARNTVAKLSPLWSILQFHELQETTGDWLKAVRPVVEEGFLLSQWTAAQFVENYRRALFPSAEPLGVELPNPYGYLGLPVLPEKRTRLAIMVAMKVTGPLHVAQLMPMDEGPAMMAGFSKSAGAATRLTLNGGRGMVRLLADADPLATGVAGVSDEGCCASCEFLTTPILKADGARKMNAVAIGHDFCKCSARLVY